MLSEITHVNGHKRCDGGPKPFKPENANHEVVYFPDSETYVLTVTDRNNPEFRLRTTISKEELDKAKAGAILEKTDAHGP